jgi:antitoxin VapB
MDETRIVKLEEHGGDQTVHLPAELHLPGSSARARRVGKTVVLEPVETNPQVRGTDVDALFARLDRYRDVPFMEGGRDQPPMPDDDPSEMF